MCAIDAVAEKVVWGEIALENRDVRFFRTKEGREAEDTDSGG